MFMTAKEVIEIVKESNLWGPLTEKERQEVLSHVLKYSQPSLKETDIDNSLGEAYSGFD
jgi:hypothetical protein